MAATALLTSPANSTTTTSNQPAPVRWGIFRKLIMKNTDPVSVTTPEKDVNWDFERREEARLDAMWDARFEKEED